MKCWLQHNIYRNFFFAWNHYSIKIRTKNSFAISFVLLNSPPRRSIDCSVCTWAKIMREFNQIPLVSEISTNEWPMSLCHSHCLKLSIRWFCIKRVPYTIDAHNQKSLRHSCVLNESNSVLSSQCINLIQKVQRKICEYNTRLTTLIAIISLQKYYFIEKLRKLRPFST